MENLTPGQLVCSTAGRDKENLYLVLKISSDNKRVWVVDGISRKIENPKSKNIKHLQKKPFIDGKIAGKVKQDQRVTNADIKAGIKDYLAC
ncbi:MAG: KOW domain-containing RNA-binding protein [Desulfotomaculum sp.]|nr:KOW domain-containing RNA-binding protein [Desulfotomaculum sp.]